MGISIRAKSRVGSSTGRRSLPMALLPLLFAALINLSSESVQAQSCQLNARILTQNSFSLELLDEVSVINGDVRPLIMVGRIQDITGDGVREVLSYENSSRIVLRNGASLDQIDSGAFPFPLPAGALPTQISLIGDATNDGVEEIGIGVRYRGTSSGQSAFVISGSDRSLLQSFPAVIAGLPQKQSLEQPSYQNPPGTSRIGVSVQVTNVGGARRIVFGDPHQHGGIMVFRTVCPVGDTTIPCFDVRALGANSQIQQRNLFASMIGIESGQSRRLIIADPSADSLPRQFNGSTDVRKNLAGALVTFENDNYGLIVRGLLPSARYGFSTVLPLGSILGSAGLLVTAPSDGLIDSATGEFEVRAASLTSILSLFKPGITQEAADLGYAIDGGLDLTGDGVVDVAVSAPGENSNGRVRIYTPGDDKQNRLILGFDGATNRFGHSLVVVAPGKLVIADLAGNLFGVTTSGQRIGSTSTTMCSANMQPPSGQLSDAELVRELLNRSRSISAQLGSLNALQGRSSYNTAILNGIRRNTDRIRDLMASPNMASIEPRINATFRQRFNQRANRLQSVYTRGSARDRRDARRALTSQANNIASMMRAAQRR